MDDDKKDERVKRLLLVVFAVLLTTYFFIGEGGLFSADKSSDSLPATPTTPVETETISADDANPTQKKTL
ncbi:hypothetical protein [Thalassotalea agarivorans]|uniref:Uncharacterized protein n=1 Tax=Thalassotalea agarivorans TaxID=349064 RepID=A0A1I0HFM3_THASX|nr:hypothetical protein [Thalassotalea agarivorans]SET82656.1 hypothetical protein SAMN05660429_02787 [Thalassotalea agarivorans]